MSTLEAKLRDHFEQMAGSEQPPGRVSIAAASRRGRTLLRWRRAWLAGTPVLAASAVAAVALTGALPSSEHRAGSHRPVSHRPAQVRVAPSRFSPLTPYASFGWLPAGERLASGGIGATADYLNADASKTLTWQLWTYAAGVCRLTSTSELSCELGSQDTQFYPLAGRAPSVNGHRAFWLSAGSPAQASHEHQAVVWQYASNGWAELANATRGHQPGEAVLRIAAHVVFDGRHRQPVEFAAQLSNLPRTWQATAGHFVVERGVLLGKQYAFTARGSNPADLPSMTTSLGRGSCYFYPGGQSARRMINGYRVVVNTIAAADGRPATDQVCVADADGLNVFISVDGGHPVISPVTLFRHMKLLGADPANWTADPIR
ncbi:MAG TPA: hypothetical protein VME44_28780 [Streptosporangiaceae bacterium]|nr:hypothetical protein [Streptosporangiaceae bacterium]